MVAIELRGVGTSQPHLDPGGAFPSDSSYWLRVEPIIKQQRVTVTDWRRRGATKTRAACYLDRILGCKQDVGRKAGEIRTVSSLVTSIASHQCQISSFS